MRTKKELCSKHLEVDTELEDFITFARSLDLPVTQKLMQERALTTIITQRITNFNSSNGYIENFMKRAGIQSSVRLNERDGSTISNDN